MDQKARSLSLHLVGKALDVTSQFTSSLIPFLRIGSTLFSYVQHPSISRIFNNFSLLIFSSLHLFSQPHLPLPFFTPTSIIKTHQHLASRQLSDPESEAQSFFPQEFQSQLSCPTDFKPRTNKYRLNDLQSEHVPFVPPIITTI